MTQTRQREAADRRAGQRSERPNERRAVLRRERLPARKALAPVRSLPISREGVLSARARSPRRWQFNGDCSGILTGPDGQARFALPFYDSIGPLYEAALGAKLRYDADLHEWSHAVESEEQLQRIRDWEAAQGTTVFLRDCLPLSIALDYSFFDEEHKGRTEFGQRLFMAKYQHHAGSINTLAAQMAQAISALPYYKLAQAIATVPPHPYKTVDLPMQIADHVAAALGLPVVTAGFSRPRVHQRLKRIPLHDKWNELESTRLKFQGGGVKGRTVILLDDIYQSGTTLQYMAMLLQAAGARRVYGLCIVKTWSDSDNTTWSGPQ